MSRARRSDRSAPSSADRLNNLHSALEKRLIITLLLLVAVRIVTAHTGVRKGPIVRQVDRILIESSDPKALFAFFSTYLQLPEAWPLAENQGYVSGALGAGNVNIEVYRYAQRGNGPAHKPAAAHFAGLALEPYPLAEALRELKMSGIFPGPPQPTLSTLPDGTKGVAWTIVPLPSFSKSDMSIFLYEYSQAFLKVDVRRKQLGNRLTLNNGGPLGIQSVREIVMFAANFEQARGAWRRLLGSQTQPGIWDLGDGPAIRLVPGTKDHIQKIVIRVRSLAQARRFLKNRLQLDSVSGKEISINPSTIQDLSITLVE
jgi:hypothetical protein